MTEEQRHSAAGSMAGMMYQVYYFLKQLLLLQPGESASLEQDRLRIACKAV